MKKTLLSFFTVFTFFGYTMYQNIINKPAIVPEIYVIKPKDILISNKEEPTTPVNKTGTVVPKIEPVVNVPVYQAPVELQAGLYKDGRYTGSSVDASYGNIQVVAIIEGGEIADVQFLDYPKGKKESVSKNLRAMPILISETIAIQDSNVNNVSGATFTAQAYRESLSSALALARR